MADESAAAAVTPPATPADFLSQLQAFLAAQPGGTAAAPAAKPAAEKAAPATETANPPDHVSKWLKSLEDRINARETEERTAKDAKDRAGLQNQITKLVGEGDVTKLKDALGQFESFFTARLSEKDKALSETQAQLHGTLRQVTVGQLTTGVKWASAAAGKDALAKLEGQFEIKPGPDGQPVVVQRGTGRAAADVVKDALASDDFAHYLDPGQRGKGGLGGGSSASPTQLPGDRPRDIVDYTLAAIEAQKAAWSAHVKLPTTFGGI